ncbi:C-type lectin domain family 7 member A [Exaiptasia diaphana]|nr:C-type lectin domain family 7 member A [Exaiptasia diaphana]
MLMNRLNPTSMYRITYKYNAHCADRQSEVQSLHVNSMHQSIEAKAPQSPDTISYPCPKGWASYEGSPSCYKVSPKLINSWCEACKRCLSFGGDLVKISSEKEDNFVGMLFHTCFPTTSSAYIGMIT